MRERFDRMVGLVMVGHPRILLQRGILPKVFARRLRTARAMPRVAGAIAAVLLTICSLTAGSPALAQETTGVSVYARVLRTINPHLQWSQSRDLASHVLSNSVHWRLDANLLVALVTVESRWHPAARSYAGALGLGQLMPTTARRFHVNPHNADQNLSGCAHYLSGLIDRYQYHSNRYVLAFAAYNAGPNAVTQYHGVPPYSETQHYVTRVMRMWHHFKSVVRIPSHVIAVAKRDGGSRPPSSDSYGPAPLSDAAAIAPEGPPPAP